MRDLLTFVAHDFGLVEGGDDLVDWVPNFKRPYPWLGEMMMMDVSSLGVAFHFLPAVHFYVGLLMVDSCH